MDISAILSDPESLKQIKELAEMFGTEMFGGGKSNEEQSDIKEKANEDVKKEPKGENKEAPKEEENKKTESKTNVPPFPPPVKKNHNAELLVALRPHLSQPRQERLDKSLKVLRMLETFITLKESGLLNDLL